MRVFLLKDSVGIMRVFLLKDSVGKIGRDSCRERVG